MSRRDGQADPSGDPKPGEEAEAPERTEPSQEEEQADEEQQTPPEGDDAANEEAEPSEGDQAEEGSDQEKKPKAEDKTDWKAKYDEGEKKRRDFESKAATSENRAKQMEEHARAVDSFWRGLVQREAPDLYEKVMNAERERDGKSQTQRSTRDASYAAINTVYREGDKAFGDYLTTLVEDADVRITPQNIEKHRRTFESLKGGGSNGSGNGATPPREPAAATAGGRTSTPPRVPAGGRAPTGGDEPIWKPGQPFDVRGNLSAGLKKSARERGQARR